MALLLLLAGGTPNPVHWLFAGPSKALRPGVKISLKLKAQIDAGWHMYAMDQPEQGPMPLDLTASEGSGLNVSAIKAPKPITVFDPNFNKRVNLYADRADFVITLSADTASASPAIQVRYQSCNDTMCLPPRKLDLPLRQ